MKKLFICVLTVLLICSLSACGNLKDTVLDGYDNFIQLFSKQALTDEKDLVGERKYADDEYTGNYEADYENFNGEELLFGGTALEREDGNALTVTYSLEITEGTPLFTGFLPVRNIRLLMKIPMMYMNLRSVPEIIMLSSREKILPEH